MAASQEIKQQLPTFGVLRNAAALLDEMQLMGEAQGAKKVINSELWHACAGPLVCLPQRGSLVYYFPQGHSEQVRLNPTARTALFSTVLDHLTSYMDCSSFLIDRITTGIS